MELLLTLSLGLVLSGIMLQALLGESTSSQRFGRLLRERTMALRGLELIRDELQLASAAATDPSSLPAPGPACSLAGRTPVLHLHTAVGAITYTVGSKPGAIWRGQVLMRCGPAYGLDGMLNAGSVQPRVLVDGLEADGFEVTLSSQPQGSPYPQRATGGGVAQLELRQVFASDAGQPQRIVTRQQVALTP